MLDLNDEKWATLEGGYRVPFDARSWLELLASGRDNNAAWRAFWEDLHHQGDVGETSYASVPHLVRIYRQLGIFDWNVYGLVACIELCRGKGGNPALPTWTEESYFNAIQELAKTGLDELLKIQEIDDVRAVLSVIALAKGAREHANFLLNYSADELLEMESRL